MKIIREARPPPIITGGKFWDNHEGVVAAITFSQGALTSTSPLAFVECVKVASPPSHIRIRKERSLSSSIVRKVPNSETPQVMADMGWRFCLPFKSKYFTNSVLCARESANFCHVIDSGPNRMPASVGSFNSKSMPMEIEVDFAAIPAGATRM